MINHNTLVMTLEYPGREMLSGLHVGEHILVYGNDEEGNLIKRPYTPITKIDKKGELDLLIKVYFKNERFPKGGKLS